LPFSRHQISVKKPFSNKKYKKEPKTLGEHLRNKRIEMNLFQREVALLFGVSEDCVTYWENGRAQPFIKYYPAIISFLGFNPFLTTEPNTPTSLGGRIKRYRCEHGLSHKKLGKLLGVHASTVGSWEKGEFEPYKMTLKKIEKLLSNIS
jgi:DNA-binding transcriptional regulator YiaG